MGVFVIKARCARRETTLALSRSFKKRKAATSQTMNTLRSVSGGHARTLGAEGRGGREER
eukprot:4431345-Pleurochrysis_carterae.AAC.1